MITKKESSQIKEKFIQYAPLMGTILVIAGLLLFLDLRIRTNWLSISIPFFVSTCLLVTGFISRKKIWLITGFILLGVSGGLFILLQKLFLLSTIQRIGIAASAGAITWISLFITLLLFEKKGNWWVLIIASILLGLAVVFLVGKLGFLFFIFDLSLSIGTVFLLWGLTTKNIGLVIPGLLVMTMGVGSFIAWNNSENPQGLKETGIMLVWFSLGWILITVVSRILLRKFIWWPLIPGGVLLMVGSGLYIGGNPTNAIGFLGNTGSIGLILFGIYLILLKYGMK
jgi:hypothetical protein